VAKSADVASLRIPVAEQVQLFDPYIVFGNNKMSNGGKYNKERK